MKFLATLSIGMVLGMAIARQAPDYVEAGQEQLSEFFESKPV